MRRFITILILPFAMVTGWSGVPGLAANGVSHLDEAFPISHGEDAVSAEFASKLDKFMIYVWREQGKVWVEIVPEDNTPSVCFTSFTVIQANQQYKVKLLTQADGVFCNDVLVPNLVLLLELFASGVDLNQSFWLDYNSIIHYSLEIPPATIDELTPEEPEVTDNGDGGGCFILSAGH